LWKGLASVIRDSHSDDSPDGVSYQIQNQEELNMTLIDTRILQKLCIKLLFGVDFGMLI
jgi:hypothetical protein